MPSNTPRATIEVFSTCTWSTTVAPDVYKNSVIEIARWSEEFGCRGILVYTDNGTPDPWLVSNLILSGTKSICPLVAVQPVYMHPYTVAKMVSSFGYFYGRRVYLNMVAGGFKNDLTALNDTTPHDQRYDRLIEYTAIIKALLASPSPVSYEGTFYKVNKLKLVPPLPQDLFPGIFVSGSSEAGLAAAHKMGATAVHYPKPAAEYELVQPTDPIDAGIRVGLITRADEQAAWHIAHERFPEDREGQLTRLLAMKTSDSEWHKQLSYLGEEAVSEKNPYWLVPFQNYKTSCPYLVGSYERVAEELARYIAVGYRKFILDIPANKEELSHTNIAFKLALERGSV